MQNLAFMAATVPPAVIRLVDEDRRAKEYRPTVVAILQSAAGFLMVQSRHDFWGYVQGGIEDGEHVVNALFRELDEETGIPSVIATKAEFCLYRRLATPESLRDGYTIGKSYFYFAVRCAGIPQVRLLEKELRAYKWLPNANEVVKQIRELPDQKKKKGQDMLEALRIGFYR